MTEPDSLVWRMKPSTGVALLFPATIWPRRRRSTGQSLDGSQRYSQRSWARIEIICKGLPDNGVLFVRLRMAPQLVGSTSKICHDVAGILALSTTCVTKCMVSHKLPSISTCQPISGIDVVGPLDAKTLVRESTMSADPSRCRCTRLVGHVFGGRAMHSIN